MARKMSHQTNKDGETITGYTILADGSPVATATKEKNQFKLAGAEGYPSKERFGTPEGTLFKTMRDLKAAVAEDVTDEFIAANAPVKKERAKKEPTPEAAQAAEIEETQAAEAADAADDGDIDLD